MFAYIDVQYQRGQSDCGLFAIVFAEALGKHIDPNLLTFNQDLMWGHLKQCYDEWEMTSYNFQQQCSTMSKAVMVMSEGTEVCQIVNSMVPAAIFGTYPSSSSFVIKKMIAKKSCI